MTVRQSPVSQANRRRHHLTQKLRLYGLWLLYSGDKQQVCELVGALVDERIAEPIIEIVEHGTWRSGKRKRGPANPEAELIGEICYEVRGHEKRLRAANGGKLRRGERLILVNEVMSRFTEDGEELRIPSWPRLSSTVRWPNLSPATRSRMSDAELARHEAELARYEAELAEHMRKRTECLVDLRRRVITELERGHR